MAGFQWHTTTEKELGKVHMWKRQLLERIWGDLQGYGSRMNKKDK